MEQGQDKLVTCKCCNGNACYESEFTTQEGSINTWLCMTCGFTSNSTMTKDSEALKQTLELTADLIKDLQQTHDGLAYFPTVITMPEKGMIFPEPTKTTDEWGWTVVKSIPVAEKEKEKYPIPNQKGKFYEKRMDMKNMKRYDKLCFMDAAEDLGMFDRNLVKNAD
tara:strand:+ start:108 stop:605 length:498 start_codon:yes stop_codon:yes gene_type:complete